MLEIGKVFNKDNFKISIDKLAYKALSEILESSTEDTQVVDEFRFTISNEEFMFTTEGYHINDDTDSYCISIYDTTDGTTCDTYNRVCTSYYDSCGGCEADVGIQVWDVHERRREDFEKAILDVLFGTNSLIIAF